jgi:3-hydroxyacyl-CoA dehydrogenase
MRFRSIGVVGAGVIGVGVALICSSRTAVLVDLSDDVLRRAKNDVLD